MSPEPIRPAAGQNVGAIGGDLASRWFALAATGTLTVMSLPPIGVSDHALKLFALIVAIAGTLLLMAGLVFFQKTHYAGLMLIPCALAIIALANPEGRPAAAVLGVFFMAMIAGNLWNRRCALNRLLGINSCA